MASAVFLCFLAISMVAAYPEPTKGEWKYELGGKIIGGTNTTIQKYPFAATLWMANDFGSWDMCGAVIASNYWVITAAHCNYGPEASEMYIRAGNTYRDNGTRYDVAQTITHPNFLSREGGESDFDLGLLKLKTPIVFSSNVQAVSLPSASTVVNPGTVVTMVGWGATHAMDYNAVEILQEVSMPAVSIQDCAAEYGEHINRDTMICAGFSTSNAGFCHGDSGGPLVQGSTLVGVASWGGVCTDIYNHGVYTNVIYFRDWIKTETGL